MLKTDALQKVRQIDYIQECVVDTLVKPESIICVRPRKLHSDYGAGPFVEVQLSTGLWLTCEGDFETFLQLSDAEVRVSRALQGMQDSMGT